jgi:eukaryotic-like serine/threonine-protein kinase
MEYGQSLAPSADQESLKTKHQVVLHFQLSVAQRRIPKSQESSLSTYIMNRERWHQLKEIFHSALERAPEERASFLNQACGDDEALRSEVESLISSHDQASDSIEIMAAEAATKMLAADRANPIAGKHIGRYQVLSRIGGGGMGEVFLAQDTSLGRKVALKLLRTDLTRNEERLRRFRQEARAASSLNHPNILTIHEIGQDDTLQFIATEYVEGETLREHITRGRMTLDQALDAAVQTTNALSAAHQAGIVHRDIKPENIMVRRDGYVKVLDFGLAKLAERNVEDAEATTLLNTRPGIIMGTVNYMSPEQVRGVAVDERTDIWSLGVVLYEMVTGEAPFKGETPSDVMAAVLKGEAPLMTEYAAEIPHELERIVRKALNKKEEERYQSAQELLIDLKSLRRELEMDAEVGSKQPTRSSRPAVTTSSDQVVTSRFSLFKLTRNRIMAVIALVGVLMIAGLAYTLVPRQSSMPAPQLEIRSLAVLPLENLSGDPSQEYLADGMTEALITNLGKIGALRVISRPPVMKYKKTLTPLSEIARELKVDGLVIGSVLRSGERVRATVQLIHPATDRQLWSESYERDLRDLLTLQAELASTIASEIQVKITAQERARLAKARAVNPEAYEHYLRAKFLLGRANTADNQTAIELLERAVAQDPNFAAGYAELASAYVERFFSFSLEDQKKWEEKTYIAMEKALSLDPDLAEIYVARASLLWTPAHNFAHERAIHEYRRALALNPNLDQAHQGLANIYNHIGLLDQGLQEEQKAAAINPNSSEVLLTTGDVLSWQGKYEEALSVWRSIPREYFRSNVRAFTAWALFQLGRRDEASATIDETLRDDPEDTRGTLASVQALLLAAAGQHRQAEDKIQSAAQKKGFGPSHHTAYFIASAYSRMNKAELAVKWLQEAADTGFPCYPLFERDSNLDPIRKDPRFTVFMAKLKTQWEHYRATLL